MREGRRVGGRERAEEKDKRGREEEGRGRKGAGKERGGGGEERGRREGSEERFTLL